MKELFTELRLIIHESMTIFTKSAFTGRLSLSFLDVIGYFIVPLLIIIITYCDGFTISNTLNESIIGLLSIFVVLVFQVVFIATDKFSNRVRDFIKKDTEIEGQKLYEDEKNYLIRMRNYTIQFVRQLVLLLLLSLFIILCSSLGLCFRKHIVQVTVSALMLSSFYVWLVILLKMIVSIYNIQMEDIKQNYNRIRK